MANKFVENNFVSIKLDQQIVVASIKLDLVDLKIAKESVNERIAMLGNVSYPLLINIKSVKTVTKEARDFLASEEGCKGVKAASILIDSVIGSMIGNFFIRISKPLVPTRLFTNEEEAKKWLSRFSS